MSAGRSAATTRTALRGRGEIEGPMIPFLLIPTETATSVTTVTPPCEDG